MKTIIFLFIFYFFSANLSANELKLEFEIARLTVAGENLTNSVLYGYKNKMNKDKLFEFVKNKKAIFDLIENEVTLPLAKESSLVYNKNFTTEELNFILSFYKSEVGKKYIEYISINSKNRMPEYNFFTQTELGEIKKFNTSEAGAKINIVEKFAVQYIKSIPQSKKEIMKLKIEKIIN